MSDTHIPFNLNHILKANKTEEQKAKIFDENEFLPVSIILQNDPIISNDSQKKSNTVIFLK